jgi:hypothetical protein
LTAEHLFDCTAGQRTERLFVAHMFTERAFRVKHLGTDPDEPLIAPGHPSLSHPLGRMQPMTATALRTTPSVRPAARRPASPRPVARIAAPRVQRTVVVRRAEAPAVSPATYRRRRLAALALVALVASMVFLLATQVGHADAELDGPAPAAPVYVVQDGDTLWSIAAEVAPDADRREVVGILTDAAGGDALVPGQRIELPRYFD